MAKLRVDQNFKVESDATFLTETLQNYPLTLFQQL